MLNLGGSNSSFTTAITSTMLEALNGLPRRVDETDQSPNSISRQNGMNIVLSIGGRPYVCPHALRGNGSKDIIGEFVPVLVNFKELTVAVVQGEKGKPFITVDNIITPEGKVESTADTLILFNTYEEQRLYDPHDNNSQDMASAVDPTGGFVYTCDISGGERYGWFVVPAQLIHGGLSFGQRMSVLLQVRQLVFKEWQLVSD